jgi:hypothetical protein
MSEVSWTLFVNDRDQHVVTGIVDEDIVKFNQTLFNSEWFKEQPSQVQELIRQFPSEKFYTDKDGTALYRVYGVCQREDGIYALQIASAHFDWVDRVCDGILPEDLVMLDHFTDAHYGRLMIYFGTSQHRDEVFTMFLNPLGWRMIETEDD